MITLGLNTEQITDPAAIALIESKALAGKVSLYLLIHSSSSALIELINKEVVQREFGEAIQCHCFVQHKNNVFVCSGVNDKDGIQHEFVAKSKLLSSALIVYQFLCLNLFRIDLGRGKWKGRPNKRIYVVEVSINNVACVIRLSGDKESLKRLGITEK